jgi:gamma-glutamyl hydrolase
VLTSFNAENISLPLNFTAAAKSSRMFGSAKKYIRDIFADEPVTMNNHQSGVSPATFAAYPQLSSFYNVLSTNFDKSGNEFISTWEAYSFPIYGTQWQVPHSALTLTSRCVC